LDEKDYPRVTRVGRGIRRYRIDELPQLFNVLKGDMGVRIVITEFIDKNFLFSEEEKALVDSLSFLESGIVDSTGFLEIVESLEDRFSVSVEDDELVHENLDSIERLTAFVSRELAGADKEKCAV
jgi:lipopolysaccharide/colanic/teichoic acid biosynthesis glycosyltransferase